MTHEQYSKATDIRVQIQHYQDIVDVLINSKGNELCARKITDLSLINSVCIKEEPIRQKMIDLVKSEINILEEEFSKI